MANKNTFITISFLAAFVLLGVAAIKKPAGFHKNLKVLPQDISDQQLDSIMKSYNVALGVDCKFCHVPLKDTPFILDYPSDTEPMKENAREMISMNIYINKTYFYFDKNQRPEYLQTVHCNTCHHGEPLPEH
jgi:hypothetical protein